MKPKKSGPKGPRPGSAASLFRKLIERGLSDKQVWSQVHRKFPNVLDQTKWYRWKLYGSSLTYPRVKTK